MLGLSVSGELADGLVLKAGAARETAKGRDRVTPLSAGTVGTASAVFSGPSSSSADLTKTTLTLGLSWRY